MAVFSLDKNLLWLHVLLVFMSAMIQLVRERVREMEEVFNRKIGGKQLNKIRSQDSLAPIKTVSAFIAMSGFEK